MNDAAFRILRQGLSTTIQDQGRAEYRNVGVPVGGPMDWVSQSLANRLVGNSDDCACLEMTLRGDTLEFLQDSLIAVTGAETIGVVYGLDGQTQALPLQRPVLVRAGSTVDLGTVRRGCRITMAIAGGIVSEWVLGSRATLVRSGFSGTCGRCLQEGDIFVAGPRTPESYQVEKRLRQSDGASRHDVAISTSWYVRLDELPSQNDPSLRLVPGMDFENLMEESQHDLVTSGFRIRSQSDRMGYRLSGPRLIRRTLQQLKSTAVVPGTLQLPDDGQVIVLGADCAPTGGYAQLAHVIRADLPRLGQMKPGDEIQFRLLTFEDALNEHRGLLERLNRAMLVARIS